MHRDFRTNLAEEDHFYPHAFTLAFECIKLSQIFYGDVFGRIHFRKGQYDKLHIPHKLNFKVDKN